MHSIRNLIRNGKRKTNKINNSNILVTDMDTL